MTIGIYSFELHVPQARSLKNKRQVVKRLKDHQRARYNVAVAENADHADLWQRAGLTVVSISTNHDALTRLFEAVHREAQATVPGEVIELGREFIDGAITDADVASEELP